MRARTAAAMISVWACLALATCDEAARTPPAEEAIPGQAPSPTTTAPHEAQPLPAPELAGLPAPGLDPPSPAAAVDAGAPDPGQAQLLERDGLRVTRLVLARGVDKSGGKREPLDPGTTFSVAGGDRIYAFVELDNPERAEGAITVSWLPEGGGRERGSVEVTVGAQPRWRTWAYTRTLNRPGRWTAVVRDAEGELLASAPLVTTQ